MKRSTFAIAVALTLGIAVGAGLVGFVKGKEASMFLAELAPGANMGKHYHPGDAFAYILEGTMLLEIVGKDSVP